MMEKSSTRWVLQVVLTLPFVMLAWSCGGGGGGAPPTAKQAVNIDQDVAEAAVVIIQFVPDPYANLDTMIDQPPDGFDSALTALRMMQDQDAWMGAHVASDPDKLRAGSISESKPCAGGGTSTMSGHWTGPDELPTQYEDLCKVHDATMTMTYKDCVSTGGDTTNGSNVATYSGPVCRPRESHFSYDDFSVVDSGSSYFFEYPDLDLEYRNVMWGQGDTHFTPTSYRLTVNGGIETSFKTMVFDQYVVDYVRDGTSITKNINGALTGGCMDGWVTVTTISPIRRQAADECPYEGHLRLSGSGDNVVDIVYNSDGSMDVADQHFEVCDGPDLPTQCR